MNFLQAFMTQRKYNQAILDLEDRFLTAGKAGGAACNNCGCCCWKCPGHLSLPDIINISGYLGLTIQDFFFGYVGVEPAGHDAFRLVLLRMHQRHAGIGGCILTDPERVSLESACCFHAQNICGIHPVRPMICKVQRCYPPKIGKVIIPTWSRKKLNQLFDWSTP